MLRAAMPLLRRFLVYNIRMQPLSSRLKALDDQVDKALEKLGVVQKQAVIARLETELAQPDAWNDSQRAAQKSQQMASLQTVVAPWVELDRERQEARELLELSDESLLPELDQQITRLEDELLHRKKELLFEGEYDNHAAILKFSAGAGGTDAQDWTEMLERMYLRWAEKTGLKIELIERSSGDEAGIKSATYSVTGPYAYGKLQSEHGVHRLVRLSPFNSDNLRQTSFALVEVLPEIDAPDEVQLDETDLKIDVYRAGGHGGQSVNTTDSAVRVTHLPTNTIVAIQNERSQLQNKETALKILRSRLAQMQLEQHAEKLSDLRAGESASWGAQIRNYVLHPYTLVKDTRTKHEDRDANGVLDGKLDEFMTSYLEQAA